MPNLHGRLRRYRVLWVPIAGAILFFAATALLTRPVSGAVARASDATPAATIAGAPGTIAYVHNSSELHLIQPDGSGDRVIWSEPAGVGNALGAPAWRPDGGEIAFVSTHETSESLYQSDVFGVSPSGTGFRRITNPPDPSQLGSFPKGTVSVTVTNNGVSDGLFVVYMEGADQSQSVTINPGDSKTVTFSNVAVFANQTQFPMAASGVSRWFGSGVTVTAGGTVSTTLTLSPGGQQDNYGVHLPAWRHDSAELDYALGFGCTGIAIPANPAPGTIGQLLIQPSASMCPLDRGPTTPLQDQILYWDGYSSGFYRVTQNSASAGTEVLALTPGQLVYSLRWLPDGSGFVYAASDASEVNANVFEYDFGASSPTQLTQFSNDYASYLSISPDGQFIAFQHSATNPATDPTGASDVWIMRRDGSQAGILVANASFPSWGTPATSPPGNLSHRVYLPAVFDRQ